MDPGQSRWVAHAKRPLTDYPVLLNNLLREHPAGNLSFLCEYEMTREGPEDAVTHFATFSCKCPLGGTQGHLTH